MTPNDTMPLVAASLRDILAETPILDPQEEPEDVLVDLACRLVMRMMSDGLTIQTTQDHIRDEQARAAQRIFNILTDWITRLPGRSCCTSVSDSGRFEITLQENGYTRAYFRGASIQDAYAQAAQTITLDTEEAAQ